MKAGKLVGECIEHYLSLYGAERDALAKAEYLAHQITPLAEAVVMYEANNKTITKNARKLEKARIEKALQKIKSPSAVKSKKVTAQRIGILEQAVRALAPWQQFGQPINYTNGHRPERSV